MPLRRPKSTTTDYRPPSVKRGFPLEREITITRPRAAASRNDPWDAYAARDAKEAAEHDRAVSGLKLETALAMAKDLGGRPAHDRRDHEQRWVMGRRAAVLRMLLTMRGALA